MRVTLVAGFEGWRLDVKGATPDLDLGFAMLRRCVSLVEALKSAVVTLVQTPGLVNGQPVAIELIEHMVERVDRTLQEGRVAHVEIVAGLMEGLAAGNCLLVAGLGEVNVGPAGEEVELVPFGLAVTHDNKVHVLVFCHEGIPSLGVRATPRRLAAHRTMCGWLSTY